MDTNNSTPKKEGIKTYTKDMVSVIGGAKGVTIKEIIEEEERKKIERELSPQAKKNRNFMIFGFLLLLLSGALIAFWFLSRDDEVLDVRTRFQPLIFHDSTVLLEIGGQNRDGINNAFWQKAEETQVKEGGLEGIYLTENKKIVGLKRMLALLKASPSSKDLEPISDNMLIGVFNRKDDPSAVVAVDGDENVQIIPEDAIEVPTIEIEGEPVSLATSAFFKTGTVEFVNQNAKEEAKETIKKFLEGVDFKTSKIKVLGTYSVERPWDRNQEIAEARRDMGVEILMEVLLENFSEDERSYIAIESDAMGVSVLDLYSALELSEMSKDEMNSAIDATQGIQYEAIAKTKSTFVERPLPPRPEVEDDSVLRVAGDYIPKNGNEVFLLIKVRSFTDVFPVMRKWEGKIFSDLHGVFGIPINVHTSYLLTKNFTDGIVENKNARILYTNEGEIALMYIFADETSIVITNSENVADEVMRRLAGSRIRK